MARGRRTSPFIVPLLLVFSLLPSLSAQEGGAGREFRFRYTPDERFRILGVNRQQVYLNGNFSHSAVIVTRVVEETAEVDDAGATVEATYQVTEENSGTSTGYSIEREYESHFYHSDTGEHRALQDGYMPVMRGFPRFPEEPVVPGDSWSREAWEVHDFRRGYGIEEPYRFSMPVVYTYDGRDQRDGEQVDRITASYTIFHRGPAYPGSTYYPQTITGTSKQQLYWSEELGRLTYTEEEYTFLFILNSGDRVEYRGTATYEVVKIPPLERPAIRDALESIGGGEEHASGEAEGDPAAESGEPRSPEFIVEEREEGVTLVLEDLYFEADSARLTDPARSTLKEISRVLQRVSENDILITGHTALAGNAAGREALSRERARRVAERIVAGGSHREEQVLFRGMGARRPAASNASEAGRRRNRRVEITILE